MAVDASARERGWSLLLAASARRRAGTLPKGPSALAVASGPESDSGAGPERDSTAGASRGPEGGAAGEVAGDALETVAPGDARAVLVRDADGRFAAGPALDADTREFVELYLPLLGRGDAASTVIAHLGQSVDGRIATASGHSAALTGRADFEHMHRLRALADVVLVGAGTVAADDPRLTTRLVDGPDPVRVVVDPGGRLDGAFGVFTDGAAPTLHVRADDPGGMGGTAGSEGGGVVTPPVAIETADGADGRDGGPGGSRAAVETLRVAREADGLSLPALLEALAARGLRVVFVEGGGVTVTRWLNAGLLDRLHVVAAPVLIGDGRPALHLPAVPTTAEALRPRCRLHLLGQDVLWDFDLREAADEDAAAGGTWRRLTW